MQRLLPLALRQRCRSPKDAQNRMMCTADRVVDVIFGPHEFGVRHALIRPARILTAVNADDIRASA